MECWAAYSSYGLPVSPLLSLIGFDQEELKESHSARRRQGPTEESCVGMKTTDIHTS